jgi:hypothetical protein
MQATVAQDPFMVKDRPAEGNVGHYRRKEPARSSSIKKPAGQFAIRRKPTPLVHQAIKAALEEEHPAVDYGMGPRTSHESRRPRNCVKAIANKFEDIARSPSGSPTKSSQQWAQKKSNAISEYAETPPKSVRQAKSSTALSGNTTPTTRETFRVTGNEVASPRKTRMSFDIPRPQYDDEHIERILLIDRQFSPLGRNLSPSDLVAMRDTPSVVSGLSRTRLLESPAPSLPREDTPVQSISGALPYSLSPPSPNRKGKQVYELELGPPRPPSITPPSPPKPLPAPPSPGSNVGLHSMIRRLQRDLDLKVDEARQLRRLLATKDDRDVGALGEEIQRLRRERDVWRAKAEAAERRVGVYEQLTNRIRSISATLDETVDTTSTSHASATHTSSTSYAPNTSVEDEVHDNRRCVSTTSSRQVVSSSSSSSSRGASQRQGLETAASRTGLRGNMTGRNISVGAAQIWMAAQELLRYQAGEKRPSA